MEKASKMSTVAAIDYETDYLDLPGDFGGNIHRGTRSHSMQSFGGPFNSKIA